MSCCYNTTRTLVVLFLLIGLVGIVLAGVLDFWWKFYLVDGNNYSVALEQGLWRSCGGVSLSGFESNSCKRRESLLKFEGTELDFNLDIVLVSLIGSSFFTLVSLIMVAINMCQKYPSKVLVVFHLLFLLLGASGGIFGLVWALLKINESKDWAIYVLYGANGSLVLAIGLSLILLCARAPGYYLVKRNETV